MESRPNGNTRTFQIVFVAMICVAAVAIAAAYILGSRNGVRSTVEQLQTKNLVPAVVATAEAELIIIPADTATITATVVINRAGTAPAFASTPAPLTEAEGLVILPTATPTPDIVLTEMFYSERAGVRIIVEALDGKATIAADAFPYCNPNYAGICLPANYPRIVCGDLGDFSFAVVGVDQYGLDADEDGVACEDNE